MDFFEHQDQARRSTTRLVVLFLLAVAVIVVLVNLIVAAAFVFLVGGQPVQVTVMSMEPRVFWIASVATVLIIGIGSLVRVLQLAKGGSAVARMLGARLVKRDTQEAAERRLLNVVDEMAIASGVTVPEVYVMDDQSGINAFAAGFNPNEAVVAVTRGTLDSLSRDELQGVIAHEFSHILNGDMRLNIRLMGVLNGILVIGAIGMHMLRSSGRSRVRFRGRRDGRAVLLLLAVGLGLMIVGYAGVFGGRLIKAGVSRQREFLADASAVQFTRQPAGIAGALHKIRNHAAGSEVANRHAEEMSHMFFGQALRQRFAGWMATHPPLEERIRRIDPGFDAKKTVSTPAAAPDGAMSGFAGEPLATEQPVRTDPDAVVESVGAPQAAHVALAARLRRRIPDRIEQALSTPSGARDIVFCLVLDDDDSVRKSELEWLSANTQVEIRDLERLWTAVAALNRRLRLPLLDMAMASLKTLAASEGEALLTTLDGLVRADARVVLEEYVVQTILVQHLGPGAGSARAQRIRYKDLEPLRPDCAVLLSMLAWTGNASETAAQQAFAKGMAQVGVQGANILERSLCTLSEIEQAVGRVRRAAPQARRRFIRAAAETALSNGRVLVREAELLRALSTALDCPMPPILDADARSTV